MRIAILSDIHGNPIALDAVLADIQKHGGVDGYWILGDLCALGFDPVAVLDRLAALPNVVFVRGNADRYVVTGQRPPPSFEEVAQNPQLIPVLAEVAGNFGWTQGFLAARGWLDWLGTLPLEQHITLPDGMSVLLVHGAPGTDDTGLNPGLSDAMCAESVGDCTANLICVGHFHMPMDRRLNGQRIINPGAVSNNFPPDLRAAYAILAASEQGYDITFFRVTYDLQAAIEATKRCGNPGIAFLLRVYEGRVRSPWQDVWDGLSHSPPIVE